jgi:ribosomal protein S8E
MTLIIQKPTGAKLNLRKTWQPMDPDAAAYITAVETADTQPLEEKTKIAIDNFVLGCKADGIWTAIKASCILAGARTLNGALVPLVGTAPTNIGGLFVSDDYNRKTGLIGDKSAKALNSNRANNADPTDNKHFSTWVSSVSTNTTNATYLGAGEPSNTTILQRAASGYFWRVNSGGSNVGIANSVTGFLGAARSTSAAFVARGNKQELSFLAASATPGSDSIGLFARNQVTQGGFIHFADPRLAFYSIGESLDLALLDARVTDLINAFGAAIP